MNKREKLFELLKDAEIRKLARRLLDVDRISIKKLMNLHLKNAK